MIHELAFDFMFTYRKIHNRAPSPTASILHPSFIHVNIIQTKNHIVRTHYLYVSTNDFSPVHFLQAASTTRRRPKLPTTKTDPLPISTNVDTVAQKIVKTLTINIIMGCNGEIVGLARGYSGGSCESHDIYGHHVAVGDLVNFKVVVLEVEVEVEVEVEGEVEVEVETKISDITKICHVGFLRMGAKRKMVSTSVDKCWSSTKRVMT
jgi:hypothetical protein